MQACQPAVGVNFLVNCLTVFVIVIFMSTSKNTKKKNIIILKADKKSVILHTGLRTKI